MYFMVCGFSPFDAENEDDLFSLITDDPVTSVEDLFFPTWVSEGIQDFIYRLMNPSPDRRLGGSCISVKTFQSRRANENQLRKHRIFQKLDWDQLQVTGNRTESHEFNTKDLKFDREFTHRK